jgi:hypothetical protein
MHAKQESAVAYSNHVARLSQIRGVGDCFATLAMTLFWFLFVNVFVKLCTRSAISDETPANSATCLSSASLLSVRTVTFAHFRFFSRLPRCLNRRNCGFCACPLLSADRNQYISSLPCARLLCRLFAFPYMSENRSIFEAVS